MTTDYTPKQELIDELDAFDPKWRDHYATLLDAAIAANAVDLHAAYKDSPEGQADDKLKATSRDWNEVNRRNRALREAEVKMANEGN